MIPEVSRRQALQLAAAAVAAMPLWEARPANGADPGGTRATLLAFGDTIVPGEKRSRDDRVVAGATHGPGAVQAGMWALLNDPQVGLSPALPGLAAGLDAAATREIGRAGLAPDPTVPPFVGLPFRHRTAVAERLLRGTGPDQLAWYALAAMAMLAFHTAAHLDTPEAVRRGHPGLAWLDFPRPDADGLWRYEHFSYGRRLAREHPRTTRTGNPG